MKLVNAISYPVDSTSEAQLNVMKNLERSCGVVRPLCSGVCPALRFPMFSLRKRKAMRLTNKTMSITLDNLFERPHTQCSKVVELSRLLKLTAAVNTPICCVSGRNQIYCEVA